MQDNQRQTQWQYIAGVMDSDGCFMITKHNRKTLKRATERYNKHQWSATYFPCVKIGMVEPQAVNYVLLSTGFGKIYITGTRPSRPNSLPMIEWFTRKKEEIIPFIEKILPFLKVKKRRAIFLLDYCNGIRPCAIPYYGLSEDELNYREDSYKKMRELNGNKVAAETKPLKRENVSDSPTI